MTADALSPYPDARPRASFGRRAAQLLQDLRIGELWHDEAVTPARVARFRDKAVRLLLLEQWVLLAPIAITAWFTGNSWIGLLVVGGLFHACTSFFRKVDPIGLTTRSMIATGLLLDVLLLIYALTGTGSWQMDGGHMWVFAVWSHALGLLCWRSLLVSGTLGILHHFVLVFVFPLWVFPDGANIWRVVLHAARGGDAAVGAVRVRVPDPAHADQGRGAGIGARQEPRRGRGGERLEVALPRAHEP